MSDGQWPMCKKCINKLICDCKVSGIWALRWNTYSDVAANFFDGVVAGALGQNVREQGFDTHSTSVIVHAQLVDEQRL